MQARRRLAKILVKRPKETLIVANVVKHAYLGGGLDTEQVRDMVRAASTRASSSSSRSSTRSAARAAAPTSR